MWHPLSEGIMAASSVVCFPLCLCAMWGHRLACSLGPNDNWKTKGIWDGYENIGKAWAFYPISELWPLQRDMLLQGLMVSPQAVL